MFIIIHCNDVTIHYYSLFLLILNFFFNSYLLITFFLLINFIYYYYFFFCLLLINHLPFILVIKSNLIFNIFKYNLIYFYLVNEFIKKGLYCYCLQQQSKARPKFLIQAIFMLKNQNILLIIINLLYILLYIDYIIHYYILCITYTLLYIMYYKFFIYAIYILLYIYFIIYCFIVLQFYIIFIFLKKKSYIIIELDQLMDKYQRMKRSIFLLYFIQQAHILQYNVIYNLFY